MIRDYRKYITILVPFLATFIVFLIIQQLITRSGDAVDKNRNPNLVEFIRIKQNDNLQERSRVLPEKPPQPKRPPQPKLELDDSKPPPIGLEKKRLSLFSIFSSLIMLSNTSPGCEYKFFIM